jgi:hypothetical protein
MQEHRLRGTVGPRVAGAEDCGRMTKPNPGLKARLYEEVKRFLMIFAYLWLDLSNSMITG